MKVYPCNQGAEVSPVTSTKQAPLAGIISQCSLLEGRGGMLAFHPGTLMPPVGKQRNWLSPITVKKARSNSQNSSNSEPRRHLRVKFHIVICDPNCLTGDVHLRFKHSEGGQEDCLSLRSWDGCGVSTRGDCLGVGLSNRKSLLAGWWLHWVFRIPV